MTKKIIFIVCSILCIGQTKAQYTSIPDTCFESILVSQNIDSDNTVNGQILTSDINTITTLDISSDFHTCGVSDIIGIEDFTLLEILFVNDANLSSIDMSNNLQLKRLYCKNNVITQVTISQNNLLERLDCRDNNINTLDVSQNLNLKRLNVRNNNLTNLNINLNSQLEILHCEINQLNTLDVSHNINLFSLGINDNQITSINVNNLNQIKYFTLVNNNINSINIDNNTLIEWFWIINNQITSLNLNQNHQLSSFWCQDNSLTELNLSQNLLLDELNCSNNQLSTLNVQNGANSLLTGAYLNAPFGYEDRFKADNNPNLSCILVDDAPYSTTNWLSIDATSTFVENQTACDALSLTDEELKGFSLFPNPSNNSFSIQSDFTIKSIEIYSVLGSLVKYFNTQHNNYTINELSAGMYVVKINTQANGSFMRKLLKE